jgi:hypothetical protein
VNHTEHAYFEAGYKYERGTMAADILRLMIESERIEDRAHARELIEKGRAEVREYYRTRK